MKKYPPLLSRVLSIASIATLVSVQAIPFAPTAHAATQITDRNLTLKAGTTDTDGNGIPDGGSMPSGTVAHQFNFELHNTTDSLGSIKFQYCTTAAAVPAGLDCEAPAGLSTENALLGTQTTATGFTGISQGNEDDTSSGAFNTIIISRGAAAVLPDGTDLDNDIDDSDGTTTSDGDADADVSYEFTGVVNPSETNKTFFVRISTYSSLDGTGTALESGTVAASTANPIELEGTMPESLVFCTGSTIPLTAGVPDCSLAGSGDIAFDQLFSPTDTATALSQMAASTNAGQGYAITVNGPTLSSGSNTIDAIATAGVSNYGVSQFGMNLVANTTLRADDVTTLGADIAQVSNGTNFNGRAVGDYATADTYKYATGDIVADSDFDASGVGSGTDSQIYTVSYIVNVPGSQPAGTYTTTLTYICTATF